MKKVVYLLFGCSLLLVVGTARAQVRINPLSSFGDNGWLAPGSISSLTVNSTERGLAFGNDHLYLVSRANGDSIRILNPTTGADLGALNMTGIPATGSSGATFGVNMAAVGGDGAIYVGNLTLNASAATSPFVVYKWATETSAPTLAFVGTPLAGGRVGDTLAAIGSGSSTRLVAGFGNSPAVAGDNGFSLIDPIAHTATQVSFLATPPNPGDFRLGITFGSDANHVMGAQSGATFRETSVSGDTGTLLASPVLHSSGERLLAYVTVGGMPLLAAESTVDAHISLYDMTNPAKPVFLGSANATSGALHANTRDVGQLSWGNVVGNTAVLYAMSTDQGIQALVITVPEPGTLTLAALGFGLLAVWQNRRRK